MPHIARILYKSRIVGFTVIIGSNTWAQSPLIPEPGPIEQDSDHVQVRLEGQNGKAHFKLGEPIVLDLVFSKINGAWIVNPTDYGDLADNVQISPAEGWFRWQGRSGHDYSVAQKLEDTPVRVPIVLNQGFAFRQSGHYEITVHTSRLEGKPNLATNALGIDIEPMDAGEERALVRTLSNEIATARGRDKTRAAQELAFLTGDDAVHAKVRWLADEDAGVEREIGNGLASSKDFELQLKLLEDVWRDVRRVPDASVLGAIQQTRALQAGKTIPGWQMLVAMPKADEATRRAAGLHHADVQQIIDTLPQRNGQNLTDTAYFLMEYAELDAGQQEFVRPLVASEFIHMDPMAQGMLLQTRWQAVRTPTLVPALRAMLDKPPVQFVGYGDPLERLIELDPEAAAPYVQREICDPRSHVQMKQMAAIPAKTLPATDGCLLQQVTAHAADPRGAPGVAPWPEKTLVLARFASDAIYPSVLTLYQTHPGWDSYVRGAVIAYLIRWHPETVTALLPASSTTNTTDIMFSFNNVMEARHASYPEALRAELREQLTSGTDREAQSALYLLSRFGGQEDAAAALARLDRVMKEWQGRQSEWMMPANGTPAQAASMLQQQLVFALWSKEGRWQLPEPERQRVKSLCFGSVCSQSRWDGEGWKKSQ